MEELVAQAIEATKKNNETALNASEQAQSSATTTNTDTSTETGTGQQQTIETQTNHSDTQSQTTGQASAGFDWNTFGSKYGISSENDFKSLQEKAKLADELKIQNEELSKYKTFNPVGTFFKTPEDYKKNQFTLSHPDKNADIVGDIYNGKINEMSDLQAIATQFMFDHPEFKDPNMALALAKDKFGIESDATNEDIQEKLNGEPLLAAKIQIAGNDARKELNKYKDEIPDPQEVNIDNLISEKQQAEQSRLAKLQEDVTPIANSAASEIKQLPIELAYDKSTFNYDIKPEDNAQISEWIQDYVVSTGQDISKESMADALDFAQGQYFLTHKSDIINAIVTQKVNEATEALDRKYNYPGGIKRDNQAPQSGDVTMTKADEAKALLDHLGIPLI